MVNGLPANFASWTEGEGGGGGSTRVSPCGDTVDGSVASLSARVIRETLPDRLATLSWVPFLQDLDLTAWGSFLLLFGDDWKRFESGK